jgi:RHS repeat-associated protein
VCGAAGQRTTNPTAAFDQIQRMTTPAGTSLGYLSPGNGELVFYGTTMSLFTDALGFALATADDGATTLSRHYSYDPDGNANAAGSGTDSVLRYAGGHPVGNLYHYGARYYDPCTAVWTQQDPLNQISSLTEANRYTYARRRPHQQCGPYGFVSCSTFGVGSVCKKATKAASSAYGYARDNADKFVTKVGGAADERLYCTAAIGSDSRVRRGGRSCCRRGPLRRAACRPKHPYRMTSRRDSSLPPSPFAVPWFCFMLLIGS